MKKDNTHNPFLAYANYPLKDNPKNLHKIFDSIEQHYNIAPTSRTYIRRMIDVISELSEYNDPKVIQKYKSVPLISNRNNVVSTEDIEFAEEQIQEAMKILDMPRHETIKRLKSAETHESELRSKELILPVPTVEIPERNFSQDTTDMKAIKSIAIEAVYGYRDGFCEKACKQRDLMIQKFSRALLSGAERPKCYECYQTSFIHMLSMVTEGWPFSQIPGFFLFINNSSKHIKRVLQPVLVPGNATEQLEEITLFIAEDPFFYGAMVGGPPEVYKRVFHDFLYTLIAGGLAQFLLDNNRGMLHKCPICGKFGIGRVNQKYCSPKCKNKASRYPKDKMRLYQRDYRKDGMEEIKELEPQFDEKDIQELMEGFPNLNMTREEATRILKEE